MSLVLFRKLLLLHGCTGKGISCWHVIFFRDLELLLDKKNWDIRYSPFCSSVKMVFEKRLKRYVSFQANGCLYYAWNSAISESTVQSFAGPRNSKFHQRTRPAQRNDCEAVQRARLRNFAWSRAPARRKTCALRKLVFVEFSWNAFPSVDRFNAVLLKCLLKLTQECPWLVSSQNFKIRKWN